MMEDENSQQAGKKETSWEREALERLAREALTEQRRARRWGIFFKALFLLYLFALLAIYLPQEWRQATPMLEKHTSLVDVDGVITAHGEASADNIVKGLRRAFEDDNTAGIVLRLNSPGGSPVQSGQVHDEIRRLRKEHPDIPLYAAITDVCASGCYYIAAAADRIFADKASIVGSIGVRMDGFGFVEAIDKLGIERRLLTAGPYKGLLDPFLPEDPVVKSHLKGMLEAIHRQFIDAVKQGRGERLADDPELFTGLVWTGEQALELGLVDELASPGRVAREVIKAEKVVDYTRRRNYLDRFSRRFGSALIEALRSGPVLR
ncbi:MAG: S49 family peptidase [Gammaproteobacteria bacterium]|nr:MAG: S49 family peptidase [Gammaproteobacteria bacterium]